ncbi:MAG: NAD(+) synthase [Prevotellaceae bacterium]|nr:NAD(+) synthase [Prevotellaceae bacterium]
MINNYGFIRVATAIPNVKVADCRYNVSRIKGLIDEADSKGVQLICFPELCITAYTCADLFLQKKLLNAAEQSLSSLLEETKDLDILFIVGLPKTQTNRLYNIAVVCQHGKILGAVPKMFIPNYNEFYEKRWFSSGKDILEPEISICGQIVPFGSKILFEHEDFRFGIEICEDLWLPQAPSCQLALAGAQVLFNLSASDEVIAKNAYLKTMIAQQSAKCIAGYVYVSSGFGESSTDLVFAGNGLITENGSYIAQSERFKFEEQLIIGEIDTEKIDADRLKSSAFYVGATDVRPNEFRKVKFELKKVSIDRLSRQINPQPFVPSTEGMRDRCNEIFSIQTSGLATRLYHTGIKQAVIGISGGLDSTLALLVCVKTFDKLGISRKNIVGITMPGYGTTGRTYNNSLKMMRELGISIKEISIKPACDQHFKDIEHDPRVTDITYENTQARERTQILMDYANKVNGLVIGTGDLSELALGWATYNGDHMSMYAVNTSIPKTLVKYLVKYAAEYEMEENAKETLLDVVDTPISPELLPADKDGKIAQKTEDSVGPYELHDFFIYYTLRFGFSPSKIFFLAQQAMEGRYDKATIIKWMKTFYRRFFNQQFKRSCMPDGPKVGSVCLSPRGDWRMPSDASYSEWMNELDEIEKLF